MMSEMKRQREKVNYIAFRSLLSLDLQDKLLIFTDVLHL